MKIAILTYHNAVNYGAVLQGFALQTAMNIRYMGNEIGLLDYNCKAIDDVYDPLKTPYNKGIKNKIKGFAKIFLCFNIRYARKKKFQSFIKYHINLFPFENNSDKKNIIETVDKFIVGSDQVWNFDLSNFDDTYLLDFVLDDSKKYSYAASIGKTELTRAEINRLESIKNFKYISVRENTAAELVKKITGYLPKIVLDPVFLLSKECWRKIEIPCNNIPERYVLVYRLKHDVAMMKFALRYAKDNNCQIVIVQGLLRGYKGCRVIRNADPGEFLWLIDHAQCVITHSFHGTAFSILFEKNFYVDLNIYRATRIKEIIELLGLNSHVLNPETSTNDLICNWDKVRNTLDTYRKKAFHYLDLVMNEQTKNSQQKEGHLS